MQIIKCLNPVKVGPHIYPCGKCPLCKNVKRIKQACRALLGYTSKDGKGSFVCLTYRDDQLPPNGVERRALTKYHHKLRKLYGSLPPWFACGEYGDDNLRPHYHLAYIGEEIPVEYIQRSWKKGFVTCGPLNQGGAVYITKDMVKGRKCPDGKNKPFVRFSNHFPDGLSEQEKEKVYRTGEITINGKSYPFPEYLKRRYHDDYKLYEWERVHREHLKRLDKLKKVQYNYDRLKTPKEILEARAAILNSPRRKKR